MKLSKTPTYKTLSTAHKDSLASPTIDTAFINMDQITLKSPQEILQKTKSFSNIRKTSLDYTSCKHSSNVSQTCQKPDFSQKLQKTSEIYQNSQALLKHLKSLSYNNNSFNLDFSSNFSKNKGIITNTTQKLKNPINKKFIDLHKRGGSITNVNVNVNLATSNNNNHQNKQYSLNSSNNISNTSIHHHNKGKSTHILNNNYINQENFGKELENQTLTLIQELKNFTQKSLKNSEFGEKLCKNEEIIQKVLGFFKKIPGNDPLLIALIGQLEDFLMVNLERMKENYKENQIVRIKEAEAFKIKSQGLEEEILKYQKKQENFLTILEILKSQGVDLEDVLRKGLKEKKEKSTISSENSEFSADFSKNIKQKACQEISLINDIKHTEFADESLINDSEESSFNYYGKPESPLTSISVNEFTNTNVNKNIKEKKVSEALKLNLKAVVNRKIIEESTSESKENNYKQNNKFFKKKM